MRSFIGVTGAGETRDTRDARSTCREIRKDIKELLNSVKDFIALRGLGYKLLRNLAEKKLMRYNHFFL